MSALTMKYSAADYFNSLSPVKDDRSLGRSSGGGSNSNKAGRCHCCPYGYHIDLDFVRYCHGLAKGTEQESATLRRLKQSKRQRRRETHSMEMMLGLTSQPQQNGSTITTISETTKTTLNNSSKIGPIPPPRRNSLKHLQKHLEGHNQTPDVVQPYSVSKTITSKRKTSFTEANNALQEAMQDFEDAFENSNEESRGAPTSFDLLQHSSGSQKVPLSRRLGVSPAEANTAMASLLAQSAVNRVRSASVTRSNSLPRYFPDESPHAAWFSKVRPSYGNTVSPSVAQPQHHHISGVGGGGGLTLKDALASLESARVGGGHSSVSSPPPPSHPIPDDSISVTSAASQLSTSTLQSIRDQMATGLSRLRELEAEVRNIPQLQREVERLRVERQELQRVIARKEPEEKSEEEWDRKRLLTGSSRHRRRSQSPIRVNLEEFCSYRRARRGSTSDCSDNESVSSDHHRTTMRGDSATNNHLFITETSELVGGEGTGGRVVNGNISKLSIRRSRRDASTSCRVLTRDVGVHHAARTRSVGVMADLQPSKEIENSVSPVKRSLSSLGTLPGVGANQERNNAKAKLLSELGRQNSGIITRLSSEAGSVPPPLMFDNSTNTVGMDVRHHSTMTDTVRTRDQKTCTLLAGGDVMSKDEVEKELILRVREKLDKERKEWERELHERISQERREWENEGRGKMRQQVESERKEWEKEYDERIEREKRMWQREVENSVNEKTKKSYKDDLEQAVNEKLRRTKREWELESDEKIREKINDARKEWEVEMKRKLVDENQRIKREGDKEVDKLKRDWERELVKSKRETETEMREIMEKETEKIYEEYEKKFEAMKDEYEEDLSDKFEEEMRKARINYEVQLKEEVDSKVSVEVTKSKKVWESNQAAKIVKPLTRDREVQATVKEQPIKCDKCSVTKKSVGVSWDKVTDVVCDTCKDKKHLKPITKNCYIQTEAKKVRVAACQAQDFLPTNRDVATNTSMILSLKKEGQIGITQQSSGSPAVTPEQERRPFGVNICDKCNDTIKSVAKDFVVTSGGTVVTNTTGPVISMPLPANSANSKIPRLVDPFKIDTPPQQISNFRRDSELRRSDSRIDKMAAASRNLESSKRSSEPRLSDQTPDLLSDTRPALRRDSGPLPHSDDTSNKQKVPFNRQQTYTKLDGDEETSTKRKMSSFNEEEEEDSAAVAPKQLPVPVRPLTNPYRRERSSPEISTSTKGNKNPTSAWENEMMAYNKKKNNVSKTRSPSPPKAPTVPSIVRTSPPSAVALASQEALPKPDIQASEFDSDGEESIATMETSSVAGSFTSQKKKTKLNRGVRAALKVLNDSIGKPVRSGQQLSNALNIIQRDWFRVTSQSDSDPHKVEDYIDIFEMQYSRGLLHRVVNLADANGNTAMHYAVSLGNYDVVSLLLDSKVCSVNQQNKAGYTATMLVSLAPIKCVEHASVVEKLFSLTDVNVRAHQHGQTALMLAVSHGRLDTVKLLVGAGADVNIQDDDGSTALMCAAEHGHLAIVRYLLQYSDTDAHLVDNDGSSALAIAVEAGHKDVGVLLYKHMNLAGRGSSPYSSLRGRGRGHNLPRSSMNTPPPRFSAPPSPGRSRRGSGPPSPPGSLHNSPHNRHKPSSSASLSNLNF